jgi:hypothetical protein
MKILYLSLFPENNNCNEVENLKYFINSSIYHNIKDEFSYRLFSCHEHTVKQLRSIFNCEGFSYENFFNFSNSTIQVERLFFDLHEKYNLNSRREHEISWGKKKIFTFMCFKQVYKEFDYIVYIDSDTRIDSKDVYECCKVLQLKNKGRDRENNYFINIPYILKDKKIVVDDSFGAYILPCDSIHLLEDIIESIYEYNVNNQGIYFRRFLPDWIIRQKILKKGLVEIRGESCNTKHYINSFSYYEYDSRKITI